MTVNYCLPKLASILLLLCVQSCIFQNVDSSPSESEMTVNWAGTPWWASMGPPSLPRPRGPLGTAPPPFAPIGEQVGLFSAVDACRHWVSISLQSLSHRPQLTNLPTSAP